MAKDKGKRSRAAAAAARREEAAPAAYSPRSGEYVYDARRYLSDVKIPGYGSFFFTVLGVCLVAWPWEMGKMASVLSVAGALLVIGGLYTLQRTFVAHAYPRVVRLDAEGIEFESFGKSDRFKTKELTWCAVREAQGGRIFVRLGDTSGKSRRYFLSCADMGDGAGADGQAVQEYLLAQEERLDPDGIRVRARKH